MVKFGRSRPQKKNKIWSFQVVVAQRQQKNVQKKRDVLAELLFAN